MDQSDRDRLAYLEAEVAALKAKDGRKVLPAPPIEPKATITRLVSASAFVMPTDSELQRLREIVCKKFPQLSETAGLIWRGSREENDAEYFAIFKLAFEALGSMRRLESPDRRRYISFWMDHCERFLRTVGKWPTLRFAPFMVAVLAHGDVQYSGLFIDGAVIELGIGDYSGRAATDAWKRVLETRELLPMAPAHTPMAPRSPSRVVIGDRAGW